jgi:hypothetical protein
MAQPTILTPSARAVAKFGNSSLPNGQGTLANIDLNDGVNTFLRDLLTDDDNRQIGLGQLLYRARSVYLSDDFGPRSISLPMVYQEDGSHFLGQFLAALSQAGEQQLTFDNVTYILTKFHGVRNRKAIRPKLPWAWSFNLELIAKSPWFQDAASTTMAPLTLTIDAGQSFTITYAGSVFCEPVWTYHVPVGNAVAINAIQLKNTMSGEFLTVNFLSASAIPATTVRDVVIDCAAMTATCTQTGESYDVAGSFPMLYGPAGQVNSFTIITTPASGSTSGCTIAETHNPRWML